MRACPTHCAHAARGGKLHLPLTPQPPSPPPTLPPPQVACLLPPCYLAQGLNHLDLVEAERALGTASTARQRADAAARIPTDVRPFSGRARRLSDVAVAPAAAEAAGSGAAK